MSTRTITQRQRDLLEMQGYTGFDDAALAQFGPFTRVGPAVCAAWALGATLTGSFAATAALAAIAVLGAVLPNQPFDLLYNAAAAKLGRHPIPRTGPPRRFACLVASSWLAAVALVLASGHATAAAILGFTFVATAAAPALTGFCVPSWLFGKACRRISRRHARA